MVIHCNTLRVWRRAFCERHLTILEKERLKLPAVPIKSWMLILIRLFDLYQHPFLPCEWRASHRLHWCSNPCLRRLPLSCCCNRSIRKIGKPSLNMSGDPLPTLISKSTTGPVRIPYVQRPFRPAHSKTAVGIKADRFVRIQPKWTQPPTHTQFQSLNKWASPAQPASTSPPQPHNPEPPYVVIPLSLTHKADPPILTPPKRDFLSVSVSISQSSAAQEVVDLLMIAGVKGILNLTLANVRPSNSTTVVDARIIASLQELLYLMKEKTKRENFY